MRHLKSACYIVAICSLICSCSKQDVSEELFLSRNEIKVLYGASEETVFVTASGKWAVDVQIPDWVSVKTSVSDNSGCVYLSVSENEGAGYREGLLTIISGQLRASIRIIQEDKKFLHFELAEKTIELPSVFQKLELSVAGNVSYSITTDSDWIKPLNSSFEQQYIFDTELSFDLEANYSSQERVGKIIIQNEKYNVSDIISVIQTGGGTQQPSDSKDGKWTVLQNAGSGNANLVIMGDGFTKESLGEDGEYEKKMALAMEYFFSIEPYMSFRDYFNVYNVFVESEEKGVSSGVRPVKFVKNRLGSTYGEGTEISCNLDLCFDYVNKIDCLPVEKPLLVIVVLNDNKYAGTTYMYSSGDAVALCPMSTEAPPNDFEGLVHHEAGGHGFGFLNDEYVYYRSSIPQSDKEDILQWQTKGLMMNLCFTEVPQQALWNDIMQSGLYPEVGMYEGGALYQYGVWRCESNSCMNNNVPYYNSQSRRAIINRIMQQSDMPYTFEDFLRDDKRPEKGVRAYARQDNELMPLASPVFIEGRFGK